MDRVWTRSNFYEGWNGIMDEGESVEFVARVLWREG